MAAVRTIGLSSPWLDEREEELVADVLRSGRLSLGPTIDRFEEGTDFALRNVNGILLDIHRNYGMYLHFGETIGFVRWLRFEIDGGVGVQVRFP